MPVVVDVVFVTAVVIQVFKHLTYRHVHHLEWKLKMIPHQMSILDFGNERKQSVPSNPLLQRLTVCVIVCTTLCARVCVYVCVCVCMCVCKCVAFTPGI